MRTRLKTANNKKSIRQKASGQATLAPTETQAPTTEHPLLRMQRLYGNRYVQRVLALAKADKEAEATPEEVRRKFTIGQPGDRYEQEADRVAGVFIRREQQSTPAEANERLVRRQVNEEKKEEGTVQAKSESGQLRRQMEEETSVQTKTEDPLIRRQSEPEKGEEPKAEETAEEVEVTITYASTANSSVVTSYVEGVIKDILRTAGETNATITSTTRTPADQARVMYNNLETHGETHQKALYGSYGDQVIDVWKAQKEAGKSAAEIKNAMKAKINELGPSNVSLHCADPTQTVVVDIGPNSVSNSSEVVEAAKADSRVSKVIPPPQDPGIHLVIPVK